MGDRDREDRNTRDRAGGTRVRQDAPPVASAVRRLGEARERGCPPRAAGRGRGARRRSVARLPRVRGDLPRVPPIREAGRPRHPRRLGNRTTRPGNAVELAETPVFDALCKRSCTGRSPRPARRSAYPPGQMGNSEVGHLTIGAGRILFQDLARVNHAVEDGSLARTEALVSALSGRASAEATSISSGSCRTAASTCTSPPPRPLRLADGEGHGRADVGARVHRRT